MARMNPERQLETSIARHAAGIPWLAGDVCTSHKKMRLLHERGFAIRGTPRFPKQGVCSQDARQKAGRVSHTASKLSMA